MRVRYITPLLVAIGLFFSAGTAWGCILPSFFPGEEDLKYPPADAIAFQGVITKIIAHGDLSHIPHAGFQLKLKITKVYQGVKLGDTIAVNYGTCHRRIEKQGSVVNVLALHSKQEGWYAPSRWNISNNDPRKKREWYRWW